ncbi:Hypothetical predicted protein, partial [Mytilus galloprovincialis]
TITGTLYFVFGRSCLFRTLLTTRVIDKVSFDQMHDNCIIVKMNTCIHTGRKIKCFRISGFIPLLICLKGEGNQKKIPDVTPTVPVYLFQHLKLCKTNSIYTRTAMENGSIQNQMGLVAYNFEPELTVQELDDRNRAALASSEAVVQTLDEWCECGNCQEMPSLEENVCCRVSDLVLPNLEDHNCITMHHSYDTLILNSDVLALAYIQMMMYKGQQGRAPEELSNRQSRLVAYRQFICWMLKGEKLGKGRRVVIPSCVVKDIRDSFPENNNDYTGFQAAIDVRELFC